MTFEEALKKSRKHKVKFFRNDDARFQVSEDGETICRYDWATGQNGNRYWFLSEDATVIPVQEMLSEDWCVETN